MSARKGRATRRSHPPHEHTHDTTTDAPEDSPRDQVGRTSTSTRWVPVLPHERRLETARRVLARLGVDDEAGARKFARRLARHETHSPPLTVDQLLGAAAVLGPILATVAPDPKGAA